MMSEKKHSPNESLQSNILGDLIKKLEKDRPWSNYQNCELVNSVGWYFIQ